MALLGLLFVWWIAGASFNLGVDEGIYLEGGRRIAAGQTVYRDFFVLTGPLTFWIEGCLAALFGANIPILRIPLVIDVAFLSWAVYWLTSRFESRRFAAGLSMVFLVFECKSNLLVVKHRWDSAALATAAVLLAISAHRRNSLSLWGVTGALAAAAAWATPSLAWVAIPLALWAGRRNLAAIVAGGAVLSAAGALYLASRHALGPMIEALRWTAHNYSQANSLPYGSVNLAAGVSGPLRGIYSALETLPAILPIVAVLGWGWRLWKRADRAETASLTPLLGVVGALIVSAWPRWSSSQLVFVAAIPFALCGVLLHRTLAPHWRSPFYSAILLIAAVSGFQKLAAASDRIEFPTRAGSLRGAPGDAEYLEPFERRIQPGDSLFVFPYLPILYPLLDANNPTRFLCCPGMMTAGDERKPLRNSTPAVIIPAANKESAYVGCQAVSVETRTKNRLAGCAVEKGLQSVT